MTRSVHDGDLTSNPSFAIISHMTRKPRKRDLRAVIDVSEPIDKALWDFVNLQAEKEHRTVTKQVRHMLELAMYLYDKRYGYPRQEGGSDG